MKLFLLLVALVLAWPVYHHETVRYKHCLEDCAKKHYAHSKLLSSEVCMDFADRLEFKLAGTVDCELAERETRLTVHQCAAHQWRAESEIVQLYHRMTDSYWKLLMWIMPVVLVSLVMWFQLINTQKINQSYERMMDKFQHTQQPRMLEPAKPYLKNSKNKRKKQYKKDRVMIFD